MTIAKVSKKDYSKNEIKQKLRVDEYVFEIENKDIYNASVIYSIDSIESTTFKDGKKTETFIEDALSIELIGNDKDNNEAWISFDLRVDINYLNSLSKIPTDATNLLNGSESFIKKPTEQLSEFLDFQLPQNSPDDIYKNLSSLWISKIEDNTFIFKLSVPNELFTYFTIRF